MVINSYSQLQQEILRLSIPTVVEAMTENFYDALNDAYQDLVDDFYSEYSTVSYIRTFQFRDKLPVEITPYIQGNKVYCGIDLSQFDRVNYKEQDRIEEILTEALLHGSHGLFIETETEPYNDLVKWVKDNKQFFVDTLKKYLQDKGFIVK